MVVPYPWLEHLLDKRLDSFWVWRMGQASLNQFKVRKQPMTPQEWTWKVLHTFMCIPKKPSTFNFSSFWMIKGTHVFQIHMCIPKPSTFNHSEGRNIKGTHILKPVFSNMCTFNFSPFWMIKGTHTVLFSSCTHV